MRFCRAIVLPHSPGLGKPAGAWCISPVSTSIAKSGAGGNRTNAVSSWFGCEECGSVGGLPSDKSSNSIVSGGGPADRGDGSTRSEGYVRNSPPRGRASHAESRRRRTERQRIQTSPFKCNGQMTWGKGSLDGGGLRPERGAASRCVSTPLSLTPKK